MLRQQQQNDDLMQMGGMNGAPDINDVQYHLQSLNAQRILNEREGDFTNAEMQLKRIVTIREKAETGLKVSLVDKHAREEVQIEQ